MLVCQVIAYPQPSTAAGCPTIQLRAGHVAVPVAVHATPQTHGPNFMILENMWFFDGFTPKWKGHTPACSLKPPTVLTNLPVYGLRFDPKRSSSFCCLLLFLFLCLRHGVELGLTMSAKILGSLSMVAEHGSIVAETI